MCVCVCVCVCVCECACVHACVRACALASLSLALSLARALSVWALFAYHIRVLEVSGLYFIWFPSSPPLLCLFRWTHSLPLVQFTTKVGSARSDGSLGGRSAQTSNWPLNLKLIKNHRRNDNALARSHSHTCTCSASNEADRITSPSNTGCQWGWARDFLRAWGREGELYNELFHNGDPWAWRLQNSSNASF